MIKKLIKTIIYIIAFWIGVAMVAMVCSREKEMVTKYILPIVIVLGTLTLICGVLMISMIEIGKVFGKKKFKREKLSNIDRKFEEYYREILEINSPLIISLIDEYDIKKENVIAHLLNLQRNKILYFDEDTIIVKKNKEYNLNEIDKYIIDCLNNNKFLINIDVLKKKIINEAEAINLLFENKIKENSNKNKIKFGFTYLLIGILMSIIITLIMNSNFYDTFEVFIPFLTFSIIGLYIGYVIKYEKEKTSMPFLRTKKGEILNKKIEGLKNYLNHYSILSEREAKEIELWEEYLIYSVTFGQNKKIIEEYEKYVELKEDSLIINNWH